MPPSLPPPQPAPCHHSVGPKRRAWASIAPRRGAIDAHAEQGLPASAAPTLEGGSDAGDRVDPAAVTGDVGVSGAGRAVTGGGDADLAAGGHHRAAGVAAGRYAVTVPGAHRDAAAVVGAGHRGDDHVGDLEPLRLAVDLGLVGAGGAPAVDLHGLADVDV